MVPENQFYTLLPLINHQVIKHTKLPESYFLKKTNERVLSHTKFYFEDNDHKPVDFNGEFVSFTSQLIKM